MRFILYCKQSAPPFPVIKKKVELGWLIFPHNSEITCPCEYVYYDVMCIGVYSIVVVITVILWSCSIILVSIDAKPNTNDVYVAKGI